MDGVPQATGNIFVEAVLDVGRFPLWWYSRGLARTLKAVGNLLAGYARSLGLAVWVKNIFVPMFGQYDWQSRVISVFMRIVNIVGRGLAMIVVVLVLAFATVAYVALPFVAGIFAAYHVLGLLI